MTPTLSHWKQTRYHWCHWCHIYIYVGV